MPRKLNKISCPDLTGFRPEFKAASQEVFIQTRLAPSRVESTGDLRVGDPRDGRWAKPALRLRSEAAGRFPGRRARSLMMAVRDAQGVGGALERRREERSLRNIKQIVNEAAHSVLDDSRPVCPRRRFVRRRRCLPPLQIQDDHSVIIHSNLKRLAGWPSVSLDIHNSVWTFRMRNKQAECQSLGRLN